MKWTTMSHAAEPRFGRVCGAAVLGAVPIEVAALAG